MNTCSNFFKKCDVTSNRDYSKGKSFSFSKWSPSLTYTNDEFKQDFVTYNGDLYACIKTNTNVRPNSSSQWCLVVEKLPSEIAFPKMDDFGVLSWEIGSGELPKPIQIAGVPGKDGVDGIDGKDGKDGVNGTNGKDGITPQLKIEDDYWYVSYNNGVNWQKLSKAIGSNGLDGTNGKDGLNGTDGTDGKDGLTPYFLIKDGFLQVSYDGENWENLGNINNNFEWEEL